MDFNKLNEGINCNCLENALSADDNSFAIKTMKSDLRIQDFTSYWEKGRRTESNDCKDICSLKGISMSIFNEETKEKVIEIFKELFPLAPKYKPYLSVINLYENSGLTKHTPNDMNSFHYDFYKSDTFDHTKVNLINAKELY